MNKIFNHLKLITILANLSMRQETEATKYFLPTMFYRANRSIKYNAQQIKQTWLRAVRDIKREKNNNPLKLYIHIPFCKLKCNFCFYYSATSFPGSKIINHYIKKVCDEMNFYKDAFSDIEFEDLEIKGGSPSILNEKQLSELLTNLFNNFSFSKSGERNFECNPHEMTFKKLKALKKFGFTGLNFGVQSLDRKVLKLANRSYQTYELVKKSILNAQSCGFGVKIDLMIGLYGDSAESFVKSFARVAKFEPETIAMNPLHPPGIYLERYFRNNESFFYSQLENKISQVMKLIKPLADEFGYSYNDKIYLHRWQCVGFSKKKKVIRNKTPEDNSRYGSFPSVFGIGYDSISKIIGLARYQNSFPLQNNFSPLEKNYNFFFCQLEDDMRDYILDYFARGKPISQKEFKRNFGRDLINNFKYSFSALKKLKKVKIDKDLVYFLPGDSKELFIYGLFFWDKDEIVKIIRELINIQRNSRIKLR